MLAGGLAADNVRAAIETAARYGARYVGFVFYPRSPRSLSVERAAELAAVVPPGIGKVGVTVDPEDAFLDALLARVPLDVIQLHGREDPARVAAVRERTGCRVMKALRLAEAADLAPVRAYAEAADLLLFDAKPPPAAARPGLLPGGNGLSFDWRLLRGLDPGRPWLLSGGLSAGNLAEAVGASGAAAVDVSSGVESRPGVKDPDRLAAFLSAAAALDSRT